MEIQGKIIKVIPEQTGQGKNGTWRKNRFVVETEGQYPKKVCIDVWGDKFDQMPVSEGNEVVASIDVESREYNGNWYTDVKAWKVVAKQGNQNSAPQQNHMPPPPPPAQTKPADTSNVPPGKEPDYADDYEDDLPF